MGAPDDDKMSVENMWLVFACVVMSAFSYAFLKPMCTCSCRKKPPPPPPPPEPVAEISTIKIHPARANFRLFPPGEAYYLGGPPRKPVEPKAKKKPKVKDQLNAKWRQCVNNIIANNAIQDLSTQLAIKRAFGKADKEQQDEGTQGQDPSSQINTTDDNYIVTDPKVFSGVPTTANNCCGKYSNGGGPMNGFAKLVQLAALIEKNKEQERKLNNPPDPDSDDAKENEVSEKEEEEEEVKSETLTYTKVPFTKQKHIAYMDEDLEEDEIRPAPPLTPPKPKRDKSPLSLPSRPQPQPQQQQKHSTQVSQNVQIHKPIKHSIKPNLTPKVNPESFPVPLRVPAPVPDPERGPSQLLQSKGKGVNKTDHSSNVAKTIVEIRDEVNIYKLRKASFRRSEDDTHPPPEQRPAEHHEKLKRIPSIVRSSSTHDDDIDEKYPNIINQTAYTNYAYVTSTSDLRLPETIPDKKLENNSHIRINMTPSSGFCSTPTTPSDESNPNINESVEKLEKSVITEKTHNPAYYNREERNAAKLKFLNFPHENLDLSQSQPAIINVSPSAALAKRY